MLLQSFEDSVLQVCDNSGKCSKSAAAAPAAAVVRLDTAADAAGGVAALRSVALDLVAAVPDDRAHRERRAALLHDVAWMERAARRMMAVAARIGRGD